MNLRRLTSFAAAMALSASAGYGATADVTVPNFSFESSNGYTAAGPTGPGNVPNWIFTDTGGDVSGTQNQGPIVPGNPNANPPTPPSGNPVGTDGSEWAFFNISDTAAPTGTATSAASLLPASGITAGDSYTMTVALGSNTTFTGFYLSGNFQISILANDAPVASTTITGASLPQAVLTDESVTLSAVDTLSLGGQTLKVKITSTNDGRAGGEQSLFDNVRVTDTSAVPEPASLGLLGLGAMGLLARRRRGC